MVCVNQQDNSGKCLSIDVEFKISEADPCLLYRENKLGICMIIIYVDNMMVIGHKESIIDVQERVKKVFSIKTENNFTDYLGCEFHTNKDKKKRMVRTTIYYKEFGKKFSEEAMKHRLGLTPGTPRFIAMRVRLVMKKTNYQQRNMQHTEVGLVLCCISPNIADLIFAMQ